MSDTHAENKQLEKVFTAGWDAGVRFRYTSADARFDFDPETERLAAWRDCERNLTLPLPSDEPDSDGWIAWSGNRTGGCPLPKGTVFEVRFRDGSTGYPETAPHYAWRHNGEDDDIIAYRVIEPASDEPDRKVGCEGSDGLIRTHSECEYCDVCQPADDDAHDWINESRPVPIEAWDSLIPTDDGVLTGAEKHRAFADAMDSGGGPRDFEVQRGTQGWKTVSGWPAIYLAMSHGDQVRRKPKTCFLVDANGTRHEFPEPMREAPAEGSPLYVTFWANDSQPEWLDEPGDYEWLRQGRCHATREARNQHERALIAASGGSHE